MRAENLKSLNETARALLAQKRATLVWVPREQNRAGKELERKG